MKFNKIRILLFIAIFILLSILVNSYYNGSNEESNKEGLVGITSLCIPGDSDYNNPNSCFDISYVDRDIDISSNKLIGGKARISDSFYIDGSDNNIVKHVPPGKIVNPDKRGYSGTSDWSGTGAKKTYNPTANQLSETKYDTNNYNITYHTDPIEDYPDENSAGAGKMWVVNSSGDMVSVPYTDPNATTNTLYYEPGSYRFPRSNYVPAYEDSVFLSRITHMPTTSPVYNTASMLGGFCTHYKDNPDKLEELCRTMDPDKCASTSCCALLGGSRCVYGNENGPKMKSNYSDVLIANRDYYYFKGKCYGNCSNNI